MKKSFIGSATGSFQKKLTCHVAPLFHAEVKKGKVERFFEK